MANYLPTREAELLSWSNNLASQLIAEPTDYGITMEQATGYATLQQAFSAAYHTVQDPVTRTRPTVADKNEKKKALIDATRPLVQTLQNTSVMTNEKRAILGIPTRGNEPTPIGPPEEMPIMWIGAVRNRVLDVELRRSVPGGGLTRRKPAGVRGAWLYTHVGDTPPGDLTQWKFEGGTTRSNPQIVFPQDVTPGTVVWVTALWVNPTEQPGPACAPVKAHINFDGLGQAA